MYKTKVKVFEGKKHEEVTSEANRFVDEHQAEIVSADFVVHTVGINTTVFLSVVFKVKV